MTIPPVRTNNQWVYVATSKIHGKGLFARADIPTGTDIVEYAGPKMTKRDGKKSAEDGNAYVFRINRGETIDGSVPWNLGRHANHSCEPNAKSVAIKGKIWLKGLRIILKDEEITYDYGYSRRDDPSPCRCLAARCQKVMTSR